MQKICEEPGIGRSRHLRAEMVLLGLKVKDVAANLGWSRDKLYRVLRDDRALSEADYARILQVISEMAS